MEGKKMGITRFHPDGGVMIPHSRLELFDICTLSQTKLVEALPLTAAHNHNNLYMGEHPPTSSPPGEKQMNVGDNQSSKAHAALGGGDRGRKILGCPYPKGGLLFGTCA